MEDENENKDIDLEISMFDFLKGKEEQEDSDFYKSIKNIMVNTIESIDSRFKSKTNNSDFLETGFCGLDLHRGDLIVIAARSSLGQTAFALSLLNQLALNKKIPVGYISLGCTEETSFGGHLLSINSGVSMMKIRSGMLKVSDCEKINKSAEVLWESPIYLINEPNSSFNTFVWKTQLMIDKNQVQLIIINGFELFEELVDSEKEEYRNNLESLLENLKKFAVEQHIPIILEIELPPAESDTEPSLQDFKKYMIIPSMADMIILLNRSREKEEEAQFNIVKNLNGWTGTVDLTYNPKTMSFKKGSDE